MIRVFRLGDVVKILVKVVILIIGIVLVTRFFNAIRKIDFNSFVENRLKEFENRTFIEYLDDNFRESPVKEKVSEENVIAKELDFIKSVVSSDVWQAEKEEEILEETPVEDITNSDVQESPQTQVVAEHNKNDVYNFTYSTVHIRNQTSTELTENMLVPDVQIAKDNIVIFHTHTSESYTPTEANAYQASGNFRTLDTSHSVVRLGEELKNRLANKNINVIHDSTFHDYPEYNGAYNRSLKTVQSILENNSADFVIDLHRDALADSTYGPSVMIGDEKAAQLMFVLGSNEGGLSHPNWISNLKIAIKIQEKANEMYPRII